MSKSVTKRLETQGPAPKVLIQVENGVATFETSGEVDVEIIDWDIMDQGDEDIPELPFTFQLAFPQIELALAQARKDRE